MLYDLVASVWDGTGTVLELGTLLGASTQWLGLGMAANPTREGRLVAADAFLPYAAIAEMAAALEPLLGGRADWPAVAAEVAESRFRRAFDALHAEGQPYSAFLEIERCLIPGAPDQSGAELDDLVRACSPIAVLVVDSAKSWYPVRALALAVVEQLRPGALVTWQDHRWFNSFAIPYLNERLGRYMELLAIVDSMHVYRYAGKLKARDVRREIPEAVTDVDASDFRALFHQLAWHSYLRNDAYGVLSASLQLAFALTRLGHTSEATALFDSARGLPGFASHRDLFKQLSPSSKGCAAASAHPHQACRWTIASPLGSRYTRLAPSSSASKYALMLRQAISGWRISHSRRARATPPWPDASYDWAKRLESWRTRKAPTGSRGDQRSSS